MDLIIFRATGSKIKFPGFMKVYVEGTDDNTDDKKDHILPDFKKVTKSFKKDIEPKQHFTQPPPRYTEARLVKTLEELGIGQTIYFCTNLGYDSKKRLCNT